MSKHIRVRYKGLRERRRWAAFKVNAALGISPPTLTQARNLWKERRCKLTAEELADHRKRFAEAGR